MEIKVAYQGVPGAYSEKATRQLLGSGAQIHAIGFPSFDAAFQAVDRGDCDFGVLPIENSLGGSIHANYDLLLKVGLRIVGEYDLRVEHSLLALPGVKKSDIKTVISHPQALAQCIHTIEAMGAQPRAEYDTAGSAKMLADNQWRDTAAVASDLAAEYYGLQVLERNVEDDAGNFTRFLLLAKADDAAPAIRPSDASVEFKTSVVFSFMDTNEKGQLYKALSAFSLRDIDLAKIESRPWGYSAAQQILDQDGNDNASPDFSVPPPPLVDRRKYKYLFYIDIIGHETDENVVNALRHLREFCKFVRVLGAYPTKGKLLGGVRKKLEAAGAYPPSSPTPASQQAPTPTTAVAPRLNVGIYGFGNFGQFLTKTIAKYHNVRATSRTDYSQIAQSLGATYYSSETQLEAFFKDLDVLVLCMSILSFEKVVQKLPKHLLEKIVVIDVLSVKTHAKQILLRELPASSSILCTHPMFGPESGKYSWRGLNMMYEKVRVAEPDHGHAIAQFLSVFELELCRMLEMTCESHDEFAASSQFLTHLTGRILSVQGVKNTPIDTRGFKNLVRLVEDTCKDSFDLFQGLYEFNPNSESQIQKLQDSIMEVTQKLKLKAPTSTSGSAKEPETMAEKYPLNPLLNKVTAAKTVVIHGITKQLEAEGKDVWSLCVGEPDFLPDSRVLEAGKQGFASGNVKYTDVKGTLALRKGIADYLTRCKGVTYSPQTEILVSNGAKQSVFQSLMAVCKPGEKVLIPSPYWVSYPAMVKLVGAEPVVLRTTIEEQYLINPEALERTLIEHPEIKVMIFCNPSNPSGTLHSPEHLERIAAVLRKPAFRHVLVIADEIYEQLVYQDEGVPKREHQCFASLPGMYERTLLINGFSKSHAMPGLRIGYLAAPKYFVDVCTKLQGQFTSCASSIGQQVATAAMQLEMDSVDRGELRIAGSLAELDKKRTYVLSRLQQIPKLKFAYPTSAFYIFLDLAQYFEGSKVSTDAGKPLAGADDFCEYLLLAYHVALVPGSAFGEIHGLRISYASSMETLENAMDGLEKALASLTIASDPNASVVSPTQATPKANGQVAISISASRSAKEPETMAEKYPLNPLLNKVTAAKTVVIHGITKQLEAEGKDVWSLCVGEPDFLPDSRVLEAGKQGFASGNVKYTDVKGTLALRKGIADYLTRCKGVTYSPQTEILVSNGAKQSVFQSLMAVCKPGEKVLIPSPYWVSYPAMVKLVGAEPVVLRTTIEEQYLINPEALERTLIEHPEIKVMIFCNPSNPSGTLHSPEHLERIAAVLRKPAFRHVLVIADEIYEQLVYQDEGVPKREHQCFASLPGMYERTLLINGFSKSHAMPGLRIGYLAAPKYFVDVCTKLQGQFTSCASSIGQQVATAAMQLEMDSVDRGELRIAGSLAELDKKRTYVLSRLQQIPKLKFAYPTSAFYIFLDLAQYFEGSKVSTDAGKPLAGADDFCEYLLLAYHVALVPGSAFGEIHGLRISYASSMETLENAMDGLEKALASLSIQ